MTGLALAVVGASGRMGRAVIRLATLRGDRLVCAIAGTECGRDAGELAGVGRLGVAVTAQIGSLAGKGADVVIDFSTPNVTAALVETASQAHVSIVSGTTGLREDALRALEDASTHVAVLWEPNMSVGVHVLADLVAQAVAKLGPGYDIEVVETHHRLKVDAPSGTALRLAEVARAARARKEDDAPFVYGRTGRPGVRSTGEIGIHAIRGGDVIGDHCVHLLGAGERLELVHKASTRDVFAHGALRAAAWLQGRPKGRYTLDDVLTLPEQATGALTTNA